MTRKMSINLNNYFVLYLWLILKSGRFSKEIKLTEEGTFVDILFVSKNFLSACILLSVFNL